MFNTVMSDKKLSDENDILAIDEKIRNRFAKDKEDLQVLKERLLELEKTLTFLKSFKQESRVILDVESNISVLRSKIEQIENNTNLNFYTIESAEYIQRYKNLLKIPIKMSFTGKKIIDNSEKKILVRNYLKVAQKYYEIPVKIEEYTIAEKSCENCKNTKDFIYEENNIICPDCGSQEEIVENTSSYKDADRVNISNKYTYDRKVHFRDCINQYQGKQNCSIDQKIYNEMEDILERHGLLIESNNKQERFANITREHILMFLKELGYPKHYENVIFIHYNLTGKKPDDISHLEDVLLADFDILIETYDKHFKNKVDRVNFISTQYVLYQLLQRHKHVCKKEDFIMLKTADRKSFHDDIFQELCTLLGWSFHPIL